MKISNAKIEYHRNGPCGIGFDVVIFTGHEDGEVRRMMGVLFPEPEHIAIFDLDKLGNEDIKFGSNSWKGTDYEYQLRHMIEKFHNMENTDE